MDALKTSALIVLGANPKDFIKCMAENLSSVELKAHYKHF